MRSARPVLPAMLAPALRLGARGLRRLATELDEHSIDSRSLQIEYELVDELPADKINATLRGSHINETASGAAPADYLAGFSVEMELRNLIVRGNIEFIEKEIAPLLSPTSSILDVGCASGKYGLLLARAGAPTSAWQYAGVERSPEMVAIAKALLPGSDIRCSNNSSLVPFEDRSFDVAMASGMLQYLLTDWAASLDEMKRVARQFVFLSRLPVVKHHSSGFCHQTVRECGTIEHNYLRFFNRDELEATVCAQGFKIIRRDHLTENFPIRGIPELVLSYQYLLECPHRA